MELNDKILYKPSQNIKVRVVKGWVTDDSVQTLALLLVMILFVSLWAKKIVEIVTYVQNNRRGSSPHTTARSSYLPSVVSPMTLNIVKDFRMGCLNHRQVVGIRM